MRGAQRWCLAASSAFWASKSQKNLAGRCPAPCRSPRRLSWGSAPDPRKSSFNMYYRTLTVHGAPPPARPGARAGRPGAQARPAPRGRRADTRTS
eukprot:4188508-Prymnesium_polylepis.1